MNPETPFTREYQAFRELMSKRWARREWLKVMAAGAVGCPMSGWLEIMAAQTANNPQRRRSCILLWMGGGPSHIDTFDLKPGHVNGGPFRPIATSVPGVQISEHLPQVARNMQDMAIIRSMSTREGDHTRATLEMHTGYQPGSPVLYPSIGSLFSKELGRADAELPNFVSISPSSVSSAETTSPGFLGPQYAPLVLERQAPLARGQVDNGSNLRVADLNLPRGIDAQRSAARIQLLNEMQRDFLETHSTFPAQSNRRAYERAVTLMRSRATRAFDLDDEPAALRDRYGRNPFGQSCLLARRLVEAGVPFVEVSMNGWDTHQDNFNGVRAECGVLDPGWATLMDDLRSKGMLGSTLVVWMGEFGRTPRLFGTGRDHWAYTWSTVLAGGGIRGGQVYGQTSADGLTIERGRPIRAVDFIATIASALGIDGTRQNISNVGRPIRIVEPTARPIQEVLA